MSNSSNTPTVSVIIPAYNCAPYIAECLDSVLGQSYAASEVIIVDDGSTDGTFEVLSQYARSYPQVIKVVRTDNFGAAAARNKALDLVCGDYVAFMDADDVIWPDYLEVLMNAVIEEGSEIATCGYQKYISGTDEITYTHGAVDWAIEFPSGLTHVFQYSPCAKVINRSFLNGYNIRFVEGEIMEDAAFGITTNSLAKKNVALDYFGYRYRVHEGSVQDGVRKQGQDGGDEQRKFPFKGLTRAAETVLKARPEYHDEFEFCMCKALAGFTFFFSAHGSKSSVAYVCDESQRIMRKYFSSAKSNPYIGLNKCKKLPITHRGATWLFAKTCLSSNFEGIVHVVHRFVRLMKMT